MVKDRYNENKIQSMKLRLIRGQPIDYNQHELPISNDIGGLIVGDIGEHKEGILSSKTKQTAYKELQNCIHLIWLCNTSFYFQTANMVIESI